MVKKIAKVLDFKLSDIVPLPVPAEVFNGDEVTDDTPVDGVASQRLAEWACSCKAWGVPFLMGKGKYAGFALVNGKFVVSLKVKSWRQMGKTKFYRYQSPDNFMSRFIKWPEHLRRQRRLRSWRG